MNQEIAYYSTGLSNTVSHLLEDEEYLQNESACKMILYLANMGYMPPIETIDTMMGLLKTKKEETLVNYIMAVFHQLFDRYKFHINFNFELLQLVLMSIDHHYNDSTPAPEPTIKSTLSKAPSSRSATPSTPPTVNYIPIYNSISLLNYLVLVLQYKTDEKYVDNPLNTILERNRKAAFFKAIFSVIAKCDLEVHKSLLQLITIVYQVFDAVVLRESVTPQLCTDYRELPDASKVLFAQLMENSTMKCRILEYILQAISNQKYAKGKMLQQEVAMDRLIGFYLRCTPSYNLAKDDATRRPLEVFVITINQLLQSILHTEQYAKDQDWQAANTELKQFIELMRMEKDVDKVIHVNLLIMDTLIQHKLKQQP